MPSIFKIFNSRRQPGAAAAVPELCWAAEAARASLGSGGPAVIAKVALRLLAPLPAVPGRAAEPAAATRPATMSSAWSSSSRVALSVEAIGVPQAWQAARQPVAARLRHSGPGRPRPCPARDQLGAVQGPGPAHEHLPPLPPPDPEPGCRAALGPGASRPCTAGPVAAAAPCADTSDAP